MGCSHLPNNPIGTSQAPAIVDGSRNSGSEPPPCASFFRTSLAYILLKTGSLETPRIMPARRPKKERPTCEMLKPWLCWKTSGNAPKNRYRIPRSRADSMQRFKHYPILSDHNPHPFWAIRLTIGSKISNWKGLIQDQSTVLAMDLFIFSIGAIQSGLPVSSRNRIALFRRRTGWYVSGTNRTIKQSWSQALVYDVHHGRHDLTCTPDQMMSK